MRKPLTFIVTFLVTAFLFGLRVADAGYDARASELREILKRKDLRDDKEREVLTKALDDYLKHRQECLEALVRIIEASSSDTNQEQVLLYRIDGCREDVARFGDSVKSIPDTPSIGAFNFLGVSQVEEVNFFTNLTKAKIGERRDKILMNGKNVADKMNALDEKWRFLLDRDNSLDEYQKKIREQLVEIIDLAFDESDRERRTIKERLVGSTQAIAKLTKKYGRPIRELLQNLPSDELKLLASAIDAIETLEPSIEAYAKIYR